MGGSGFWCSLLGLGWEEGFLPPPLTYYGYISVVFRIITVPGVVVPVCVLQAGRASASAVLHRRGSASIRQANR
jgi:hypothetical protein